MALGVKKGSGFNVLAGGGRVWVGDEGEGRWVEGRECTDPPERGEVGLGILLFR